MLFFSISSNPSFCDGPKVCKADILGDLVVMPCSSLVCLVLLDLMFANLGICILSGLLLYLFPCIAGGDALVVSKFVEHH